MFVKIGWETEILNIQTIVNSTIAAIGLLTEKIYIAGKDEIIILRVAPNIWGLGIIIYYAP